MSSSCVRGHSWWQAWPWQGSSTHPTLSTLLPSPPWCSTGHSWHTARPPRCRLSCPPGTAGAGPRGAAPCLPSPLRGACRVEMGAGIGTPTQASFGDAGSSAVLSCQPCAVLPSRCVQVCPLPAEWATQAPIAGSASQAAGTEVVVAVEQAGVLVGLVAEQAHQRVAVGLLQVRAVPQWGENATCHLWG